MDTYCQTELEDIVSITSEVAMRVILHNITKNDMWGNLDVISLINRAIQFNPDIRVAKMLWEHPRIKVNDRDQSKQTPLHLASRDDKLRKYVELLLRTPGIDVNAAAEFGITPLHVAARFSCLRVLELLLADERVKIDAKTQHGLTALHLVAQGGPQNTDAAWINAQFAWDAAWINAQFTKDGAWIDDQVRCEAVRMLKRAAERNQITSNVGCCLNQKDELRRFPLYYGVESGGVRVVKELLNWKETEMNAVDVYGLAPLHWAALSKSKHRAKIVKLLLEVPTIDANIEPSEVQQQFQIQERSPINWLNKFLPFQQVATPQRSNCRPIDFAAEQGHEEVFEILLKRAPESWNLIINRRMSDENTLLQLATKNAWVNVLRELLDQATEADVTGKNTHKNTLLHLATENGRIEVMNLLLEHATKFVSHNLINGKNVDGNTPLHLASKNGRVYIVRVLLRRARNLQLNINEKNSKENTPLHLATENGHINVVKVLLTSASQLGLIIDAENSDRNTPLHLAIKNGHVEVAKLLLRHHPELHCTGNTILHLAAEEGHVEVVRVWMEVATSYSRPNMKNNQGNTPLHLAAKEGKLEVVRLLVASPAPNRFDLDDENKDGNTPFHLAVNEGHLDVVEYMLQHGAKLHVSRMNMIGNTPLHLATKEGHLEITKALFKHATESDLMMDGINDDGNTPLHLATKDGHVEVVKVLMKHVGSMLDIGTMNKFGNAPLKLATTKVHLDMVKVLCDTEKRLLVNPEDLTRTCFEYSKETVNFKMKEIANILHERPEVKDFLERHHRYRQVLIDAANALLVGGALIAGITFAAWLQPPLGYTEYYQFPQTSPRTPPGTFQSFTAMELHYSIRVFWVFNALSFFLAIATVISGAKAALPYLDTDFIVEAMQSVHQELLYTSTLLVLAVLMVLGSFVCAGFAVVPQIHRDTNIMTLSATVGLLVCIRTIINFVPPPFKLAKAVLPIKEVLEETQSLKAKLRSGTTVERAKSLLRWMQNLLKLMCRPKQVERHHAKMEEENHEESTRFLVTKTCGRLLEVTPNKLCVHYKGQGQNDNDVGVIQGNRPCNTALHYFEIRVKDKGLKGSIAIGFTAEHSSKNRHCGWENDSYGYTNADQHGRIKLQSKGWREKLSSFSTGDIVGAGISCVKHEIFFTKNGQIEGPIFNEIKGMETRLYPTVSLHSAGESVEVNFGQRPFAFDFRQKVSVINNHTGAPSLHTYDSVRTEDVRKWG